MSRSCGHQHGANVLPLGLWVCGKCYAKLAERPVRRGMAGHPEGEGMALRQEIVWQSEIRVSAERTTLADFLAAMVRRFRGRNRDLQVMDAYDLALDVLRSHSDELEFGDPEHDWSRVSAIGLADEEMSYWETDCEGANA